MAETDVLFAPAKLTTSLRITGIRGDGYHLIEAEMVSLDFGDTLTVTRLNNGAPSVVDFVDALTGEVLAIGEDNLVTRALALVGRSANVRVEKRISPGAGLGGGSADAAAILRWAGYRDAVEAAVLGADVAFCLVGGRARVTGIGERLEPLEFIEQTFTLLTPAFGCSTPAVYRKWDELHGPQGDAGNDLEPAALALDPRLVVHRDALERVSAQRPRLAGSGATWFVEGAFAGDGRVVAQTTRASL